MSATASAPPAAAPAASLAAGLAGLGWADAAYTLRVLTAMGLALYAGFALQLDSAASAATTVAVVMNVSRGAVISKSLWRVVGSLAGATAAVALIALFAQAPVLFVLGLGVWIGLCTAICSAFRYNRGYAAVLAGYTVTLVAIGAVTAPNRIFDLAIGRVAVVTVGVVSAALVFLVTDTGPGPGSVERLMLGLIGRAAGVLAAALDRTDLAPSRTARSRLAEDLLALDQVVEFAAVEDASFGRYAADLRLGAAELFAAMTGGLRMAMAMRARGDALAPARGQLCRTLRALCGGLDGNDPLTLARRVQDCRAGLDELIAAADTEGRAALDQAALVLDQLGAALGAVLAVRGQLPRRLNRPRLRGYVNWHTAARNGARATLAVCLAGLFWIFSAWPHGSVPLVLLGPLCALLAQNDSAAAASISFFKGILCAIAVSFVLVFGLLPRLTGFPLLTLALAPFLAAGILATRIPRIATAAGGFLVFVFALVAPANPMVFDPVNTLNTYLGFIIGAAAVVLTFRVLLPPNPRAEAAAIARSLRRDTLRLARATPPGHWLAFEHVQHQKLSRLSRRLAPLPDLRGAAVGEVVTAVLIGRQLAALRAMAARPGIAAFLRAAPAMGANPEAVAAAARAAQATAEPASAARLHELAALIGQCGDFLRGGGALEP